MKTVFKGPRNGIRPLLFLVLTGLCLASQAAPVCAALSALKLPQARIDAARSVAVGDKLVLWAGAPPTPSPRALCRVFGTALPAPGSSIGFEVWLPQAHPQTRDTQTLLPHFTR